jgi:hypothetical protein
MDEASLIAAMRSVSVICAIVDSIAVNDVGTFG